MNKTLFISRDLDDNSLLVRNSRLEGIEIIPKSLILTQSVPFEIPVELPEWIFFSSSRAAYHFFHVMPILENVKLAAIGQGTAESLIQYGKVEFVGNSNDTASVARQFANMARNKKVWLPVAEKSIAIVQQFLEPGSFRSLICYRTIPDPKPVGFPDILVFSSPSNVDSFFLTNKISSFQKIIAFGKSTSEAISRHTPVPVIIVPGTSEKEIWDTIKYTLLS